MDNHLDEKSRTRIKKEAIELQKLGEKLISLSHDQLASVDIPLELKDAVKAVHSIPSNQAKRRQVQYIGALMRKIDAEPIMETLAHIEAGVSLTKKSNTQQTQWAKALVSGDDSPYEEIMSLNPNTDRQHLNQLIRNARKLKDGPNASKSLNTLITYLKSLSTGTVE